MLPQRHRLKRRADVLRVRKLGTAWRHPLAILLVVEAESGLRTPQPPSAQGSDLTAAAPTRFAFTASRRAGSAVARNRAKRLMREAVREQIALLEPGWDCLFIAREATADASLEDVKKAVSQLLRRARLTAEPEPGIQGPERST